MAILTAQRVTLTPAAPTFVAADAAGDRVKNNGSLFLEFKNTSASPVTITINSVTLCNQGFDHDVTVTVPATTGDRVVGPFPQTRFNDGDGFLTWTYSAVTSVTVGAFTLS